jgi:hypothetical protein
MNHYRFTVHMLLRGIEKPLAEGEIRAQTVHQALRDAVKAAHQWFDANASHLMPPPGIGEDNATASVVLMAEAFSRTGRQQQGQIVTFDPPLPECTSSTGKHTWIPYGFTGRARSCFRCGLVQEQNKGGVGYRLYYRPEQQGATL